MITQIPIGKFVNNLFCLCACLFLFPPPFPLNGFVPLPLMFIPGVFTDVSHILSSTIFAVLNKSKTLFYPLQNTLSILLVSLYLLDITFCLIFSPAQVYTLFQMSFLQCFVQQNYNGLCPGCQSQLSRKCSFSLQKTFLLTLIFSQASQEPCRATW